MNSSLPVNSVAQPVNPGINQNQAANLAQSLGFQSAPSPATQQQGLQDLQNLAASNQFTPEQLQTLLNAAQASQVPVSPLPQAAVQGRVTQPENKDPFAQITQTLEQFIAPVSQVIEKLFTQFFGTHIDASEQAANAYLAKLQNEQPNIRTALADALSKISSSFGSLAQAAQAGQLDLPQGFTDELKKSFGQMRRDLASANTSAAPQTVAQATQPSVSLN